jgi:hypothetical protein
MHNRKKLIGILACTIIAAASACGDSADVTAPISAPPSPLYNGGGWVGSGNRNDSTTISPASATADSSALLGGGWVGSGN